MRNYIIRLLNGLTIEQHDFICESLTRQVELMDNENSYLKAQVAFMGDIIEKKIDSLRHGLEQIPPQTQEVNKTERTPLKPVPTSPLPWTVRKYQLEMADLKKVQEANKK